MGATSIDYAALAQQARGSSAPVDYSALAAQARGESSDSSKAQPIEQPKSIWQKAKDNFNAGTQGAKPGDGVIKSIVEDIGAGGGDAIRALAHPINTIKSALAQPDPGILALGGLGVGPMKDKAQDAATGPVTNIPRTVGQLGTGMILGEAVPIAKGVAGKAVTAAGKAAAAVGDVVNGTGEAGGVAKPSLASKLRIGDAPTSLTPEEQSAVAITKAVNPASAAWNTFLKASQDQIGNVIDYAKRNGLPISSARDLAKAAQGAHAETISHIMDNFVTPNADITVPVEGTGYQGPFTGRGRASIGDLNDRINEINRELSANVRKPTTGQAASAGASDAELESEKRALTPLLHQTLADATGVAPEAIAALRVRGGQLKTLASETQGAANTVSAADAKGGSGTNIPTSSAGIAKEGITWLRGGAERIAAGKLQNALSDTPIKPTPLIQPKIINTPEITTPEAAQMEFLRQQQLTQAAQDAAAQRSQVAKSFKGDQATQSQKTVGPPAWAASGQAKLLTHIRTAGNSGISAADVQSLSSTPAGQRLLINASDLTPGTPAMSNLVKQIKATLGDSQ